MIGDKTILGLIPARGGSKGIPHKNIAPLGGKPLIAWTIEAAQRSKYIDRLILSSEDEEIIKVAKKYGCEVPFVRPAELSQDETPGIDPVIHALRTLPEQYDYVVLLQPTSPLRSAGDIDGAIELCAEGHRFCVSVTKPDKSPYWMYIFGEDEKISPLLKTEAVRRQDLPEAYVLNGAVFVGETQALMETGSFVREDVAGYKMPKSRSIDIDEPLDLMFCELALKNRNLWV